MSNTSENNWKDLQVQEKSFRPLTTNQAVYVNSIETRSVTLCMGPAGSGKTWIPVNLAARMLKEHRIDSIIITRPLVNCGKGLGYLPGDVGAKVLPYMMPCLDVFDNCLTPAEIAKYIKNDEIKLIPLELLRGASLKNSFIFLDEAQNADYGQIRMFLTRLGKGSRMVLAGDTSQSDIDENRKTNAFLTVINKLWGASEDIGIVKLTKDDIVRHGLIKIIEERLSS